MPYLDSKIVGFINFFYDEVQKQKLPWAVDIHLHDRRAPVPRWLYDGVSVTIKILDIDLCHTKHFTREQLTWPKSSPEHIAKYAVEEIRKELDRWSLENH